MTYPLYMLGRWDEAIAAAAEIPEDHLQDTVTLSLLSSVVEIHIHRGSPEEARRVLVLYPETSSDVQEQNSVAAARAAVLHGEGRVAEAFDAGLAALALHAWGGESFSRTSSRSRRSCTRSRPRSLLVGGSRREELLRAWRLCRVGPAPVPGGPDVPVPARAWRATPPATWPRPRASASSRCPSGRPSPSSSTPSCSAARRRRASCCAGARETFERLGATPWVERAGARSPRWKSARELPQLRRREPARGEVLPELRSRRSRSPARAATPCRPGAQFCDECGARSARLSRPPTAAAPRPRPRSGAWSRCSSPTSSASPRRPRRAIPRTRASSSPGTSTLPQRLIERYGGTVEKFIGDAVMAVWGTPVANEDDAERAVRAALDLVAAVPELDPRSRRARGC